MSHSNYHSAKILVLGDSGVGKSSLIHLICHSSVLSSPQWTIGASIDLKMQNNHFLEFWDIGGSRGHKIARTFLYQDYHGIMLVFDATNKKSRQNLDEWFAEVKQRDLEVPRLTLATKKDLLPNDSVLEGDVNNDSQPYKVDLSGPNPSIKPTNTHRRHLTPSPPSSPVSLFSPSLFNTSSYSTSLSSLQSYCGGNEPLLASGEKQIIYVNTQDVLSFDQITNSKNYEKLNSFFKRVIEKRQNKFVI